MAGDLLSHEYDTVNSILNLGIPNSATASGGIYFYNDGREVPDVFHANYEYPDMQPCTQMIILQTSNGLLQE